MNIFTTLLDIQEKYNEYFKQQQKSIIDLVDIKWELKIKVKIKDNEIPVALLKEIENRLIIFNTESF